jgi:phytanoyl-CoA hydroxylase
MSRRYHSRFGGTWIDRLNFPQAFADRVRSGKLPPQLAEAIEKFEKDGVIVLQRAASEDELVRFENAISSAFRDGHAQLIAQDPGQSTAQPVTAGMNRKGTRIVDSFAVLPQALDLLSSPRLIEFLQALFDERPKLFQSLSFDMGSEQGLHQDTAYVVVNRPMEMVGCWIALEDVRPGSGELQYLIGSHRLPDFDFGGDKKHWDMATDAPGVHDAWSRWLVEEGTKRGCPLESFFARRGDILIWHADVAHGGAPIADASLSRKSLVGHFCPESATPGYVKYVPARATARSHRGLAYCSWHYDLTSLLPA